MDGNFQFDAPAPGTQNVSAVVKTASLTAHASGKVS